MFVDKSWLIATSGNGGDGVVSWFRSKMNSKGGPAGGNGGNGGSVYISGDTNCHDLIKIKHKHFYKAQHGANGGKNRKKGHNGSDIIIKVPFGTEVRDFNTKEILFDIDLSCTETKHLCLGGLGGKGNHEFKSNQVQSPETFTEGEKGIEIKVEMELKSIADVGLIGLPNVGKSSLLNAVGKMSIKTGAYPFTTLHPNLCTLRRKKDENSVVIADIPGIIEGAHRNKGLGFDFLRHVERCSILLLVIDASTYHGVSHAEEISILLDELLKYKAMLVSNVKGIIINKIDLVDQAAIEILEQDIKKSFKVVTTSAFEGTGIEDLRSLILSFF